LERHRKRGESGGKRMKMTDHSILKLLFEFDEVLGVENAMYRGEKEWNLGEWEWLMTIRRVEKEKKGKGKRRRKKKRERK
jgi:hypothetical protein